MLYLIQFHFFWLILALIFGGIVGWLTFSNDRRGWSGGWLFLAVPVFLVGLVVAALKLLPDRAGYWLDLSLLFFGIYMIGCLLGSGLRSLFGVADEPLPAVVKGALAGAPVATHATVPLSESHPGKKPPAFALDADGKKDDLEWIKGIGPKNEVILNALGIYTFCQIAAWSPDEAEWMGHRMAFPGRIERELWIDQAKILCAGGETEHSIAVRGGLTVDDAAIDDSSIAALKSGMPEPIGPFEGEDQYEGKRPYGMTKPRGGVADDLKWINGIGKRNEARLHGLGIWHFSQIAAWTRANIDWVGSYLAFPERIDREKWVEQAEMLAKGGMTAFARRVQQGDVATSVDDGSKGQHNVEKIKS